MPTRVLVADQLEAKLHRQWRDLWDRISAGSVEPTRASQGLQLVQEDRWDKHDELPYADERVHSDRTYSSGFRSCEPEAQLEYWMSQPLTKELDGSHVLRLAKKELERHDRPEWAEGIVVAPKLLPLGGYYPGGEKLFRLIAESRDFKNWRVGRIGDKRFFRPTVKTCGILRQMEEYLPGDFLVFLGQAGKRWRGTSIRHGRPRYEWDEFGFCHYLGAAFFLTHPGRITGDGGLFMDCGGAEYALVAGAKFVHSAGFRWYEERLDFDHADINHADAYYGAASGLAPQC